MTWCGTSDLWCFADAHEPRRDTSTLSGVDKGKGPQSTTNCSGRRRPSPWSCIHGEGVSAEKQRDTFQYLGRPLTSTDSDWSAIYSNISKAQKRWGMVARVLTCEGVTPRMSATFYQAIAQSTLLYGSETWDVSDKVFKTLSGFHHRVVRRLSGRSPC